MHNKAPEFCKRLRSHKICLDNWVHCIHPQDRAHAGRTFGSPPLDVGVYLSEIICICIWIFSNDRQQDDAIVARRLGNGSGQEHGDDSRRENPDLGRDRR